MLAQMANICEVDEAETRAVTTPLAERTADDAAWRVDHLSARFLEPSVEALFFMQGIKARLLRAALYGIPI